MFRLIFCYCLVKYRVLYPVNYDFQSDNLCLLQHDSCAIHVASQGKKEIVQMLLDAGCKVNVRDDVSFVGWQMLINIFWCVMNKLCMCNELMIFFSVVSALCCVEIQKICFSCFLLYLEKPQTMFENCCCLMLPLFGAIHLWNAFNLFIQVTVAECIVVYFSLSVAFVVNVFREVIWLCIMLQWRDMQTSFRCSLMRTRKLTLKTRFTAFHGFFFLCILNISSLVKSFIFSI